MEREGLNCMPEMVFEVSWEVCNKVGGIHTVIASKNVLENYTILLRTFENA